MPHVPRPKIRRCSCLAPCQPLKTPVRSPLTVTVPTRRHERVQYLDCGAAFLINDPARPGGRVIDARLIPDGVHPNAAGMDVLGLCLDPTVAYLKSHPRAGVHQKVAAEVRGRGAFRCSL